MSTLSDPETWLNQYGDILFRYAVVRLRNNSAAEDIVQETLIAGIKARDGFQGKSTEKTWLIGILKHKIIDHFRKTKNEQFSDDLDQMPDLVDQQFDSKGQWKTQLSEWHDPEASMSKDQFWKTLNQCIDALPSNLGELYIHRELKGMSSDDCCKVLNISTTNNMWVMLSRARGRLRKCLETHWFNSQRSDIK